MNLNFFNVFIRNQKKNKLISVINLLGLTMGLLSALFIFEYIFFERSFDTYHENASRIYRVAYDRYQDGELQWKTANSYYPIGGWLKDNYHEVEDWAVVRRKYNITVSYENVVGEKVYYNETKAYYASNSIFHLFTIPLLEGGASSLEKPETVVISQRAASRYFGKEDPLGKILVINNSERYTVTGVFQNIPANSHLQTDFLFSLVTYTNSRSWLNSNWTNDFFHTYVLLAPGVDAVSFYKQAMPRLIADNYQEMADAMHIRDDYYFQSVPDIHLYSNIEYETEAPGNSRIINILFGFALFLLAVAWINYLNLVTAQSLERAREIGIKKVNGAQRGSLIIQFLGEAFLFNLTGLLLVFGLFLLFNPAFKSFSGIRNFTLFAQPGFIGFGCLTLLLGIIISGIYPALALSSFHPLAVLKGRFKNSGHGLLLRKTLVTVQFVISIALLVGTLVTYRQAFFLMKKDMGVDYHSALVVRSPKSKTPVKERMSKLSIFKNRVSELSGVADFTFVSDIPGEEIGNFWGGRRKGFDNNDIKYYYQIAADDRYLDFFNVKVLAGRKFHEGETADQRTILLNRMAATRFGYSNAEDAVGKVMVDGRNREWQIIGVVDDFYYHSIKQEPMPSVISLNDSPKANMVIRLRNLQPGAYRSLVANLEKDFQAIYPNQPFDYFLLDDKIGAGLEQDRTFASVFSVFSLLAILISVIGIVGLILITISQRLKELGIRKALGAEFADLSGLLSRQMFAQFLVAVLIAVPISYYGYKNWFLASYIHQINLHWLFFVAPVLTLLVIIALVLLFLSGKVHRMNLQKVLQHE